MTTGTHNIALSEFETTIDQTFASQQIPHPNRYLACWYLLTVVEDRQRLMFTNLGAQMEDWRIEYFVDRFKFALRHCLSAVNQKAIDRSSVPLPPKVIPMIYERAAEAIDCGMEYSIAAHLCASSHEGTVVASKKDGVFAFESPNTSAEAKYATLELMRQSAGDIEIPLSTVLWHWVRYPDEAPPIVRAIADSTRLVSRRIRYEFQQSLCIGLAATLPQPPFLIPETWQFPWGGRYETTLLINSLCLRVMYHLCAVHFGAAIRGLKGGAEGDLLPCLLFEEWAHDVEANCSLAPEKVQAFLTYLTYGRGVVSPDQALQPLIPFGTRFAIPGISLLSSNIERNLLTLQTRLEPARFDAQSSAFELQMTNKLREAIGSHWSIAANQTFTLGDAREELDILLCDADSKSVLILELRWMLPPADPREVLTRKRVCHQKVRQVARKASTARRHLTSLLQAAFSLNVSSDVTAWQVHAAVVIEGFGGVPSLDEEIPIVPEWIVEAGARSAPSLRRLAEWLNSGAWLPVEGRDFDYMEQPPSLLGMSIEADGIMPRRPGRAYLADAIATL